MRHLTPVLLFSLNCAYAPKAAAVAAAQPVTISGDEADQFIAVLEAGGVEKDAEHPAADGGMRFSLNRLECTNDWHPEHGDPKTTCSVLYSDRMSEDGRHYKTLDLDAPQALTIYKQLSDYFGSWGRGPELFTGAQDIECLKPADGGTTTCTLQWLGQPRR